MKLTRRQLLKQTAGGIGLAAMPAWAAEPCMSFVGLTADLRTPEGFKTYLGELDLSAEFGIRTVVGVGPIGANLGPLAPGGAGPWPVQAGETACPTMAVNAVERVKLAPMGVGPWYYTKFPTVYAALERAVPHAESVGVTITLKPHTGITATAKACLEVVKLGAGFRGPLAVERVDRKEDASKIPPEVIDQRIAAARNFPVPLLEEHSRI